MENVYIVESYRTDYDDYQIGSATVQFVGTDVELAKQVAEEVWKNDGKHRGKVRVLCYTNNKIPSIHTTSMGNRYTYLSADYEGGGSITSERAYGRTGIFREG
jgi:hypothetical protein